MRRQNEDEKTVVLNRDDIDNLAGLDEHLVEITSERIPINDLVLDALRLEATPGQAIEDPAEIEAILGL